MNRCGVEVAELHESANLLLCRRHWPVRNGLNFICRNGSFTMRLSIAKILHLLKAEGALLGITSSLPP
jgi:hypothetical protein